MTDRRWIPKSGLCAALTLAVLGTACSHVGQQEFRDEVDALRSEMQRSDAEVEQRLNTRMDELEARLDQLDEALRSSIAELGAEVERLQSSLRVHAPVHFGYDDTAIEDDQRLILDRISAVLVEHYPQALITVEGFTDPAGSVEYNRRLGEARAGAVVDYLTTVGLDRRQLRAVSYGEDRERLIRPDAYGPGEAGRENRRVVLVIDHPGTWTAITEES